MKSKAQLEWNKVKTLQINKLCTDVNIVDEETVYEKNHFRNLFLQFKYNFTVVEQIHIQKVLIQTWSYRYLAPLWHYLKVKHLTSEMCFNKIFVTSF